jgi:hypothetical protein
VAHPAPDEKDRPAVEDAWVPGDARPVLRDEPLRARWSEAQDPEAGETWITIDLGARRQPFHALELDVADERFFREVRVEARRDPPPQGGAVRWEELARGAVYRLEHDGRRRECLRVEARGRERVLRVRLRHRDDRPLRIRGLAVRVPVEHLVFDAETRGPYRLTYGSLDREAPVYDLARTAGDTATWVEGARPARVGSPRRLAAGQDEARPWTERHPALLWVGLVAVVAALGALTWGALRRAA